MIMSVSTLQPKNLKRWELFQVEMFLIHTENALKKAYPAYFDTYSQIDELIAYINTIPNLYCVGRNGQHRYNNMDHSMLTAIRAVEHIKSGKTDKSEIWKVNTEKTYHEGKEQSTNQSEKA